MTQEQEEYLTYTEKEVEILNKTLKLRIESCRAFMACDLCPFSYESASEEYGCRLSDSAIRMVGYITDEEIELNDN